MKHVGTLVAAALAVSALAAPAHATVLNFVVSGDYSASFKLDSNPTPDTSQALSHFTVWDVAGFPDAALGFADVTFYTATNGGGIGIEDFYGFQQLLLTDGPQLFSGTVAAPTLLTGTFALTQVEGGGKYTLTVTEQAAAAVPEPATWAMMLAGFGMVGFGLRRRSTVKTTVSYA